MDINKKVLKKNYLGIIIIFFLIIILSICFRLEVTETTLQLLKCNFNQIKYDSAIAEYDKCIKDGKQPVDLSKFPKDFPAIGWACPEPIKSEFYDQTIKYNLAKKKQLKFFGKIFYEVASTRAKKCSDFSLKN